MNCECTKLLHDCKLVVLTGGPGAGKTAVLEIARRSLCEHISILPEAASIVFGGGFPRLKSDGSLRAAQEVIFHVQRGLEKVVVGEKHSAVALCDRGTIDGLAYWPGEEDEFWKLTRTTHEEELARYAAVIHLRSPSRAQGYNHSNPVRIESDVEAQTVDEKLLHVWSDHPKHYIIESTDDFLTKATKAIEIIQSLLPDCCKTHEWKVK